MRKDARTNINETLRLYHYTLIHTYTCLDLTHQPKINSYRITTTLTTISGTRITVCTDDTTFSSLDDALLSCPNACCCVLSPTMLVLVSLSFTFPTAAQRWDLRLLRNLFSLSTAMAFTRRMMTVKLLVVGRCRCVVLACHMRRTVEEFPKAEHVVLLKSSCC